MVEEGLLMIAMAVDVTDEQYGAFKRGAEFFDRKAAGMEVRSLVIAMRETLLLPKKTIIHILFAEDFLLVRGSYLTSRKLGVYFSRIIGGAALQLCSNVLTTVMSRFAGHPQTPSKLQSL